MPNTVVSPNMTITVPVVLTDPGPDWATRLYNALFTTIDAHDHSSGKGVQITPAGLNINADLAFGSNNATALRSARFTNQGSPLSLGTDIGCLYESGGNLWWNSSAGAQVQLTNGGSVVPVAALTAPVAGTRRTINANYTIDSSGSDYYLEIDTTGGAIALTLPVATAGRTLVLRDSKGNFGVNNVTLTRRAAEQINGLGANLVLSAPWAFYLLESDGTNWHIAGF